MRTRETQVIEVELMLDPSDSKDTLARRIWVQMQDKYPMALVSHEIDFEGDKDTLPSALLVFRGKPKDR